MRTTILAGFGALCLAAGARADDTKRRRSPTSGGRSGKPGPGRGPHPPDETGVLSRSATTARPAAGWRRADGEEAIWTTPSAQLPGSHRASTGSRPATSSATVPRPMFGRKAFVVAARPRRTAASPEPSLRRARRRDSREAKPQPEGQTRAGAGWRRRRSLPRSSTARLRTPPLEGAITRSAPSRQQLARGGRGLAVPPARHGPFTKHAALEDRRRHLGGADPASMARGRSSISSPREPGGR